MSTNSGESGYCLYCGHTMNEHTRASDSKCKKCKKRFYVCQATIHANSAGWRVCWVPCGCGQKYYPSTAKAARPLNSSEYASTHPQYESPDYTDYDVDTSQESIVASLATATSTAPASEPTYVSLFRSNDNFGFYGHNEEPIWTRQSDWFATTKWYEGAYAPCFQFDDESTGLSYFTWSLDVAEPSKSNRSKSHGKKPAHASTSKGASSRSHRHTHSAESIDPLQWDPERLEAETLTSGMAGLSVGEGSSRQLGDDLDQPPKVVPVFAQPSEKHKGMVQFKPTSGGKKQNTPKENFVKTEGGYVFDSRAEGCIFFAKEIKPAKK